MKKVSIIFLSILLFASFSLPKTEAAATTDTCSQYNGVTKIWWDGIELKKGQIGRLIVKSNTPLFKLDGEKKIFSRTLKAGEFYRIYAFKPGKLSVGGGYFVDRDEKVTYQTPSKAKLEAVKCINQPVDAGNSIIHYMKLNNVKGFMVVDRSTGKQRFVPLSLSGGLMTDYFGARDAIFIHRFNNTTWDLYRIDINSPYKTVKVLSNTRKAITDGNFLYSIETKSVVKDGREVRNTVIYKTDLFGKNKRLLKEMPGMPLLFSFTMAVKDDFIYLKALNTATNMTQLHKMSVNGGDTEVVFEYNEANLYSITGQDFMIVFTDGIGEKQVFDFETGKVFQFKGPLQHYNMILGIYQNKLYYLDENLGLNEVDEKGTLKKIPNPVKGEIIGIQDNYLYYLDQSVVKKVKFIN